MTQEQIEDIKEKYKMNYKVEELCKIYYLFKKKKRYVFTILLFASKS